MRTGRVGLRTAALFAVALSGIGLIGSPALADEEVETPTAVFNQNSEEYFDSLAEALDASASGDTLIVNEDLTTEAQTTISKPVTINGTGHTLTAAFEKTNNSNNSAIGISGPSVVSDVTLTNLKVDGTGGTNLHGINVYESQRITLTNITAKNFRSGVVVNASDVTINGITTSGNTWHAINADVGPAATRPAKLHINGPVSHAENSPNPVNTFVAGQHVPHVFVDDVAKDVTVTVQVGLYGFDQVAVQAGNPPVRGIGLVGTAGANDQPTASTVEVSGDTSAGENQPGWLFNRDTATSSPYEFSADAASIGDTSLHVLPIAAAPAADKFIAELFTGTRMAVLEGFDYDFLLGDDSNEGDEAQFYLNVYANFGQSAVDKFYDCRYDVVPTVVEESGFTTVTFDPTKVYPVTKSGTAPEASCPSRPLAMGPNASVRAFAINVGDATANDAGVEGYLDNVVLRTDSVVTTYDFEADPFFADVDAAHQFYREIEWMGASGTSTGTPNLPGKPLYKPADDVLRQAMAAFLYRLAGSPDTESTPHFADVPVGHQFFNAIQWMWEAGVSTGAENPANPSGLPLYKPTDIVRRQAMAAFLFRLDGAEASDEDPHFADVPAGHQFFDAIQWMFEAGVSTGSVNPVPDSAPLYKPADSVLRQAMAAFLFRIEVQGVEVV